MSSIDLLCVHSVENRVGRITGRLPQELADQIVENVLELFRYELILTAVRLKNSFFLSFFCSVLEISMRDLGMCDARIKGSHTASLFSPTRNFHVRSRFFMISAQKTHAKIRTVLQSNCDRKKDTIVSSK